MRIIPYHGTIKEEGEVRESWLEASKGAPRQAMGRIEIQIAITASIGPYCESTR